MELSGRIYPLNRFILLFILQVVCKECSSYEAPLPYLDYDAVRVCEHCYDHLYEGMIH